MDTFLNDPTALMFNDFELRSDLHFKGGGGGGGGGAISYPLHHTAFMMGQLYADPADFWGSAWGDVDIPDAYRLDNVMANALGNDPYTALSAFDPDTANFPSVQLMESAITSLESAIDDLDDTAAEDEYARFETGMRNINAVMSSAFVIGRSNIAAKYALEKAKLRAELTHLTVEANRIGIVAKKEENDLNNEYAVKADLWDFEVHTQGASVLAAHSGASHGIAGTGSADGPSKVQTALSGAMSGAAIGTSIKPGIGTVIGGALGAAAGLIR